MVKHSCEINEKAYCLDMQLIKYQNTIFVVVMLKHIYLSFVLGLKNH